MYIFRALRENEFRSENILSKRYFQYPQELFWVHKHDLFGENILDLVDSHLTKGNTSITPWISCTKSFKCVKHYIYDGDEPALGVAVIKNHNTEIVESAVYLDLALKFHNNEINHSQMIEMIRNMWLFDIEKCVLDFSTGESTIFNNFMKQKFVHLRDGRLKDSLSNWAHNYSKSNKEVLVLGEIPREDVFILDLLQFELLDYLMSKGIINELNDELLNNIIKELRINHRLFADGNVTYMDVLTEPLRSIFLNLNYYSQLLFFDLYLCGFKRKECMEEYGFSNKDFLDYLETIFMSIIENSEYLRDLTQKSKKSQKQILLVNS